jgi:hypothetical protein
MVAIPSHASRESIAVRAARSGGSISFGTRIDNATGESLCFGW